MALAGQAIGQAAVLVIDSDARLGAAGGVLALRHERRAGRSPLSPPQYADWARRMDRQAPGQPDEAIVAIKGRAVVAFYLARHNAETRVTQLDKLFVHPDLQHQGLGRMLMRHLAVSAETRGQYDIMLKAEAGHGRASGFYQKLGYTVVETRPGTPPVDVLTRPA